MIDRKPSVSCETVCSPQVYAQIEQVIDGHRQRVFHGGTLCSRCYASPPRANQRYCRECHNAYKARNEKKQRAELKRLRAEREGGG